MATGEGRELFPSRCPRSLLLCLVISSFFVHFRCEAQSLPSEEVNALRVIASKLRKNWDFSVDPCSGASGWRVPPGPKNFPISNVTCECNNDTSNVCHVISIKLNGQNLTGILPDEFASLTHLRDLELNLNYLSGTIPKTWAFLPLTLLSIAGNRISGNIPDELGSIITLKAVGFEANQLQGPIPASLGKLVNLEQFFASSNNLSGDLPESLGNLKKIFRFFIAGNPITGKIPSFIGNWTLLQWLDIQGTSLEGPFPPIFSTLTSINQLLVSDLRGGDGKFPPLQSMMNMTELVLRNLSISGQIPDYLGNLKLLNKLDLSFNNLTGPIPTSLGQLSSSIKNMFLTNNMLSGMIPDWILRSSKNLDLSYNVFTGPVSLSSCQQDNVNLVASYSSIDNNSIPTCFRKDFPCTGNATNYNVSINCGGSSVRIGNDEYEGDTSHYAASRFVISDSRKWAFSSTGYFIYSSEENYIASNSSLLNMTNPELYMTARLSPLSPRYYGLCLQSGNYTVSLHFAEIMFTDDQTYSSVGERIFDVSIQGDKVLQDFNIAKEANGTGREIIKNFTTTVNSSSNTLEIHFQWTGKGTNSIPQRSVYGPLISAISVTPNFVPDTGNEKEKPNVPKKKEKPSVGAIMGIVVASCVVILLISVFVWICFRRRQPENYGPTGHFSLKQIKTATRNFDPANKIGEGGFGPVYKGVLPDGSAIAVKQLSSKSKQGNREFINEIGMISALQHPNLVRLFGCCVDGNQLLVIYEYMENNSLARALFGPERCQLKLDWQTRHKICLGIARGLTYLHEESRLKIIHRDIKATNILLDKDLNAKISDFGLARLDEEESISTRIAGTIGYMAPEYAMKGYLTDKADVYSFGVVMLEIVSGKSNTSYRPREDCVYLLDRAYVLQDEGNLLELVDPSLGSSYSTTTIEAEQMLNLALMCTNQTPALRPAMSTVVSMLDGTTAMRVSSLKHVVSRTENASSKFMEIEKLSHDSLTYDSMSMSGQWIESSGTSEAGGSKETSTFYSTASKLLSDDTN